MAPYDGSVSTPMIGVLALQGDVREHLRDARVTSASTRSPYAGRRSSRPCDGLVIPGGESTTMAKLARTFELFEPLQKRIADGMPAFGTCAGMILLADRVLDGTADQETLGGLDITVRRNAFGRQVDSFEGDLDVTGVRRPGPRDLHPGARGSSRSAPDVEVLGRVEAGEAAGRIVAVRQGPLLATSFHPEVGGDARIHRYFVDQIVHADGRNS